MIGTTNFQVFSFSIWGVFGGCYKNDDDRPSSCKPLMKCHRFKTTTDRSFWLNGIEVMMSLDRNMRVSIDGGTPNAWFIMDINKWMIWGYPDFRNPPRTPLEVAEKHETKV